MGLAIEVIQSLDEVGNLICSRFPAGGEADLKLGAQLIVRESQSAVFMRGGKALDTFGPGRHTLTTANVPLLGELLKIPFGGDTPFKAEVMFVNHKVFANLKWGTREPILFRGTELAMVRLRAFGIMSFKVENAQLFIHGLVGTKGSFTHQEVEDFLRGIVVARLGYSLCYLDRVLLGRPALRTCTMGGSPSRAAARVATQLPNRRRPAA